MNPVWSRAWAKVKASSPVTFLALPQPPDLQPTQL